MYILAIGGVKSYGILYTEMKDYFGAGSGATAWIGSLCLFLLLGMGPLVSWLCVRFSFRKVGVAGGLLVGLGYTLCGFVSHIGFMYITFGVIAGLGYGLTFTTCATIVSYYFEKNRALANGIMASASGLATFTLPFLYRYLIDKYTLKGTWIISGAIMLHICPAACIFAQPISLKQTKQQTEMKDKLKTEGLPTDIKKCSSLPSLKLSLFKNPLYLIYVSAFTLCNMGFANTLILIPSHTKDLGYDHVKVSLSVSVMGGFEVFARIFCGWFADRNIVERRHMFAISMVVGAVFCFVTPQFESFESVAVFAAITGIFPGSFWSLMAVMVIEAVGMEDFVQAFGLSSLCIAAGFVVSQPITGWLEDITGNWNASFYYTGTLFLLATIVVSLERFLHKQSDMSKDGGHKFGEGKKEEDSEKLHETNLQSLIKTHPNSDDVGEGSDVIKVPNVFLTLNNSVKTDDTSVEELKELIPLKG